MNKDNHLIWENFHRRAETQRNKRLVYETFLQEQYTHHLIEQILIEEGLMDTVKNVAGKVGGAVKNIGATVNSRVLQPIIQKAVDWLKQNDPDSLVQIASAAQDGQGALDQVISQQGGDQVEQQITSAPVNESNDAYKELLREHILYLHNEGLLGNIAKGVGKGVRGVKNAWSDVKQGFQQGVSGEQPTEPEQTTLKDPPPSQSIAPEQPPEQTTLKDPPPPQPGDGNKEPGMIGKIVNWVKENPNMSKAIAMGIFGAASMAMGTAFISVLGTAASGYAIGGGMAGVPKYFQLRKQGVEPMEALKQAGAAAHSAGMTTGAITTGSQMVGNIANKLMSPGDASAPGADGADGTDGTGGADGANADTGQALGDAEKAKSPLANKFDRLEGRMDTYRAQSSQARDFAGRMGLDVDPSKINFNTKAGIPTSVNGVPIPDNLYTPQQLDSINAAKRMAQSMQTGGWKGGSGLSGLSRGPSGRVSFPANLEESEAILNRPGWVNRKIS